jgi:hypothetical protein
MSASLPSLKSALASSFVLQADADANLKHDLHRWFDGGRILGIDEEIGNIYARMTAERNLRADRPVFSTG